MKTRVLASIIIGGVLATSAAQAEPAFSIRDLDVIYSGFNPSFTRDLDVSNYYRTPAKLQPIATNANKSTCHWLAVKNNLNSLKFAYPVANNVESNYLPSRNLQLFC
jgi:hypothetical protein